MWLDCSYTGATAMAMHPAQCTNNCTNGQLIQTATAPTSPQLFHKHTSKGSVSELLVHQYITFTDTLTSTHTRCRHSLDTQSAATLVHSFVSSRVDYCNALLAGAPKVTTNKLQRVMNAVARVITGTHKFDRKLSRILHTELHWLNVPERVMYKLCIMVYSCIHGQAPQYLVDLCLRFIRKILT